jgi:hypothetical protein
MNKADRAELKRNAYFLARLGETPEIRAEGHLLLLTEDYDRNPKAPDFSTYASNWLAALRKTIDAETMALLEPRFPACEKRMIETGCSDWGSYGQRGYSVFRED